MKVWAVKDVNSGELLMIYFSQDRAKYSAKRWASIKNKRFKIVPVQITEIEDSNADD